MCTSKNCSDCNVFFDRETQNALRCKLQTTFVLVILLTYTKEKKQNTCTVLEKILHISKLSSQSAIEMKEVWCLFLINAIGPTDHQNFRGTIKSCKTFLYVQERSAL